MCTWHLEAGLQGGHLVPSALDESSKRIAQTVHHATDSVLNPNVTKPGEYFNKGIHLVYTGDIVDYSRCAASTSRNHFLATTKLAVNRAAPSQDLTRHGQGSTVAPSS